MLGALQPLVLSLICIFVIKIQALKEEGDTFTLVTALAWFVFNHLCPLVQVSSKSFQLNMAICNISRKHYNDLMHLPSGFLTKCRAVVLPLQKKSSAWFAVQEVCVMHGVL